MIPSTTRSRTAPLRTGVLSAFLVAAAAAFCIPTAALPAAATTAVTAAPAARVTTIPSTCTAAVTLVRPDRSVAVGVVRGTRAQLMPTGVSLAYTPRAITYVGTSASRGLRIDRYFALDSAGALHRIAVSERPARTPRVTLTDTVLGTGWASIRTLVASGPYLYGTTASGGLKRYSVASDYTVRSAGTLATRGWGGVRSLSFGGWWKAGGNRRVEDIVGLSNSGSVAAYMIARSSPLSIRTYRLTPGGWGMFSHVTVGECESSNSRPILGVKPNGDVHAYYDVNGNDQSWRDLRTGPRVATGWKGLVGD